MSQELKLVKREGNRYDLVLRQTNSKYLLDVIVAKIKDGDGHYVLSFRSPIGDNVSRGLGGSIAIGKISELEEALHRRALAVGDRRALTYRIPLTDASITG
jgi:hypothetical protein